MAPFIRKATVPDVKRIHAILMECAGQRLLLPRSLNDLYSRIRDFVVVDADEGGAILGCCALSITWEDIAEIRSLVVLESLRGQGWGRRLVEACMSDAVTLGLYRVFTLTYQVEFFNKLGYSVVGKEVLPQKVWADCIHCPQFPECDETAMLIEL
ncbi:N-acetyltransferase [Nitratidesulfovibrio vulgaris]|jgi:amino-acid N-acetyltransferase|uniref:Acetyltransferase, GNAT family n=2 Tax=Nitratidesulfovibrio vulgaris TaxID=881 RepID=Q72BP7_NITV2|nr:N-acetyltransferase [Nitratidesulfovibrio vulgaris]GEB79317.1 acetyltransferase [Desulfovibrio desulfuricans]HBW16885.1 N-acetyltransferase [Desulfovibrio sp.]AAS96065.1 acetyltransferase, GNAT family [Nitratidesulfovibrio vulgaris str. Hildenborough]ABM28563.1 N-acetylglutamate synthase [Nitratidesulfovibrio vulgaris DP4]ADP86857.1 GCN5-related N-acetyltransferase [Nitratidesulfovibrio vulgaris RCH1]